MLDALRGGILGRDMSKFITSTSKSGSGPEEGKTGRITPELPGVTLEDHGVT